MRSGSVRLLTLLALLGGVATACDDSTFGNVGQTLDAEIVNPDTTLFVDATATFTAVAEYAGIGAGEPVTIQWGTDDTSRIRLVVSTVDRTVRVTGRDTGQAFVFALINETFRDSVLVTVVESGMIRWRMTLAGTPALHPATDDSGNVHVMDGNGMLWSFSALGDTLFNASSCAGTFGPAVRTLAPVTAGAGCTRQHEAGNGAVQWTAGTGDAATAPALAADGATVVVSHEEDTVAGIEAVVVTRLSTSGALVWQDTLDTGASELPPGSAPAIAPNGDIFVTWRSAADSFHLTRLTGLGVEQWTIDLPAWARNTTPAVGSDRVVVGFEGGIAAYGIATGDTLWSASFATPGIVSSPIIDGSANVYIQTVDALFSYTPAGAERWVADSLGASTETAGVGAGAPTLLLVDWLIVACDGAVCAVDAADGSLVWRAPTTRVVGSPAVDRDGQIYVTSLNGELIAIFGNRLPAFNGWPAEGGDQRRSRRRL